MIRTKIYLFLNILVLSIFLYYLPQANSVNEKIKAYSLIGLALLMLLFRLFKIFTSLTSKN